jgi:flagellin-like hook-associated protein FlgL
VSSISSNIAAIVQNLKAQNADPKQDPAKALKRLHLAGKAGKPYTDILHFSTSDIDVVARKLDDERESLEQSSTQAGEASAALTKIEDVLKQAKELVESNVNGSGRSRRKSNQRQIDDLLGQIDDIVAEASESAPELFAGSTTLKAGDDAVDVERISRQALGRLVLNGHAVSLADIQTHGALDSAKRRSMAEGAKKSIAEATETVQTLRDKLDTFREKSVRPRLGDLANAVAGLYTDVSLGDSDQALEVAHELRDLTLDSSTAALAVGAETWDRQRIIDLLT